MIPVAVVGAAGYAGVELTRILAGHPSFELEVLTSSSDAGRGVRDVYPALAALPHVYEEPDLDAIAARASVAFLAVPHTVAMSMAPQLLEAGLTVVDASADFRLRDPDVYAAWYGVEHTAPTLLADAVYGLPELDRSLLTGAKLIACPGCYPTAALLACIPAIEAGLAVSERIIIDAKSGVSGAGRGYMPATHFPTVNESVAPYKVATHRHTPEIAQVLGDVLGRPAKLTFTPHLVPMTRGLLATAYIEIAETCDQAAVHEAYAARYASEPFVTVHGPGRMPSTGEVRGSNRAHIGVAVDADASMLVVTCAIDNLVKGTSGQAVQCANLALGLDETAGLAWPVPVV